MKQVFANMGWLLGGRGFNAVLSLVYLAIAARTLGTEGFGHFALIIALGQAITGFSSFQTWQFIVRWGANPDEPGVDLQRAREATGFAVALDGVSVVVGTLASAVLVLTAPLWLDVPAELMWLTFAYCVISLLTIRTTPTGMLRLHSEYGRATWAEAVQPVIRAGGAVLAWWAMPDVTGFILAFALSEVGTAIALWIVAARVQPVPLSSISLRAIPARHKDAWRFVLSTNMSGSLAVAGKQVMILLVGTFGGAYLAGGFRIANQLGVALIALAQTISKAILPELVQSRDGAVEIARRMANIAAIAGVTAVVTAILFGRPGLALIAGEQFTGFYWAMIILSIAGAVELVGASLESLLISAGKAHVAFLVRLFPTILALVMLELAIGWKGAQGAGFAVLGSSVLTVVGFYLAIVNLKQFRLVVDEPEAEGADNPPAPPKS
ncbi:oligosaccharide flippase family protein [Porphyrobacter sp. SLTP]|jgi:O-antigen/teichoic acid export membrane protein|uniref:lipopolysaccharide biosynthesis protein n=1 Tax=Porphyrobacter sp. SLTP TaxID=2683266 RepID=UPI001412B090|nr:oligosaccharide flippase family protein [Porphyrobacter sp. SLTP]NBB25644.1 oligosaccharide flippase family protein [Porphyrobacter sp. SLTP]